MEVEKFAKFKQVDLSNLKKYKINIALKDVGFDGEDGTELFGQIPNVYLFSENIILSENTILNGTGGVYIIDGSLNVDGDFTFFAYDSYTILVINGDLSVSGNLIQYADTQFIVSGNTKVNKTLWLNLSDAGFTVFRGNVETESWCQTNDSVEDSLITIKQIEGYKISDNDSEYENLYEKFEKITERLQGNKKAIAQQRFGAIGVLGFIKVDFVLGSWFFIRYIWVTKSPTDAKPRDVVRHIAKKNENGNNSR